MKIKHNKNNGFTIWELLIVIGIIGILAAMAIPTPHRYGGRPSARKNACFSNIRVLQGAIEMYNMDVDTSNMMLELNDENHKILIKSKYIKGNKPFVCPEPYEKGNYLSVGDLTGEGVIYCTYHGTLDEIKITPNMTYQEYINEKERIEKEKELAIIKQRREKVLERVALGGGILGLISFMFVLMPQSKKKKV